MTIKNSATFPRLSWFSLRGSSFKQPQFFLLSVLLSAMLAIGAQGTWLVDMAQSQTISSAKVQEIVDGTEVYIQSRQAKVNDVAYAKNRVNTGNSRTELLLNNNAVVRLAKNSALTIGQCANLRKGSLMISGKLNGCTANITTGVRGTTYLIEIGDDGKEEVKVLEGEVVVTRDTKVSALTNAPLANTPDDTSDFAFSNPMAKDKQFTSGSSITAPSTAVNNRPAFPNTYGDLFPRNNQSNGNDLLLREDSKPILETRQARQEIVLKAGEKVELDVAAGVLGAIQAMSQGDFEQVLRGNLFQGFQNQIPGFDKVRNTFQNLFPGAEFPIAVPRIPTPNLPSLPSLPF